MESARLRPLHCCRSSNIVVGGHLPNHFKVAMRKFRAFRNHLAESTIFSPYDSRRDADIPIYCFVCDSFVGIRVLADKVVKWGRAICPTCIGGEFPFVDGYVVLPEPPLPEKKDERSSVTFQRAYHQRVIYAEGPAQSDPGQS